MRKLAVLCDAITLSLMGLGVYFLLEGRAIPFLSSWLMGLGVALMAPTWHPPAARGCPNCGHVNAVKAPWCLACLVLLPKEKR